MGEPKQEITDKPYKHNIMYNQHIARVSPPESWDITHLSAVHWKLFVIVEDAASSIVRHVNTPLVAHISQGDTTEDIGSDGLLLQAILEMSHSNVRACFCETPRNEV